MTTLAIPVHAGDHVRGPESAPITLVEYGDYECPYCGQAYYVIQELEKLLGESMRFVFRNSPLSTVHPHAELAAEAAEAAGARRKFWPMHDTLYVSQEALEFEDLIQYATMIGLNGEEIARDLATHRFAGKVREDFMGGVRSGVNGTPTLFFNGVRHDGSFDLQSLLGVINGVL